MDVKEKLSFSFTAEQIENLKNWKTLHEDDQVTKWATEENEAIRSFQDIIKNTKFQEGNDLTSDQLDVIFKNLRSLIRNRTLTKNLYNTNGLSNFNARLRKLLFSEDPLAKRINQFMELKGVRTLTVSQFLFAFDPKQYPEIGGFHA